MCGRFESNFTKRELADRFFIDAFQSKTLGPRYNVAPAQEVPVIVVEDGKTILKDMHWGLIPSWASDPKIGYRMINARSETLLSKPAFRTLIRRRRCLVPAKSFYEWTSTARTKTPYRILLENGDPFAMAGLWDHWEDGKGKTIESFTIITTKANSLILKIHDRMPVILSRTQETIWLDPQKTDVGELTPSLTAFPSERMTLYPVSTLVNSPKNDRPECILPAKN